ncbi:MAG: alpha-glucosidase [Clostridia bacterium]|nr:alpha-glucosidase [Clostridia bacterium]
MLKLSFDEKGITLLSGFGHRVRFDVGAVCMTVGVGKAKYKMDRGSFEFSEKKLSETRLRPGAPEPDGDAVVVPLYDANEDRYLTARLSVCGDRLDVDFTVSPAHPELNRMELRLPAFEGDRVYGCGEIFPYLDLRGRKVKVWVAEHNSSAAIGRKLLREKLFGKKPGYREKFELYETYYAQPTFVSSRRYFFHSDAQSYCEFDFSQSRVHVLRFRQIAGVHVGFAPDFETLSGTLSALLGRQPVLPEWANDGVILGVQGGTDAMLAKLAAARAHDTPVAAVWCQDWEGRRITAFGSQLMWNWEYDPELYDHLGAVISYLHENGIRFMGYVNPFLAIEGRLYEEASAKGYCVKNKAGEDYLVTITTFPAAMVDLTNPDAYEWLKNVIKTNMIGLGLDGWMADFGEYLPTDSVLFSGEEAELVHCTWPARWAKLNREAVAEAGREGDVFFFTRAGHTGTVKYSTMMWNGDQHTDFSADFGIGSVIPATLNLAMSGFGLTHSDLGGYTTFPPMQRNEELFFRWCELSAFSPLMRSHEGNRPAENVQFDRSEKTLDHHARYSKIHKALAPYINAAIRQCAEKGTPVMRPLFYHYDEYAAYNTDDEYLLGRDILVAPIISEGVSGRLVWLPEDEWTNVLTGERIAPGPHHIKAGLDEIPVFVRTGSEIESVLVEEMKRESADS